MRRLDLKQYKRTPLFCSLCLVQPLKIVSTMAVAEFIAINVPLVLVLGESDTRCEYDYYWFHRKFFGDSIEFFFFLLYPISLCRDADLSSSTIFLYFILFNCLFFARYLTLLLARLQRTKKHLHYTNQAIEGEKKNKYVKITCIMEIRRKYQMCANDRLPTCEIQSFRFIFSIIHTVNSKSDWSPSFLKGINWIMTISVLFALNYRENDFVFCVNKIVTNSQWKSINQSISFVREKRNEKKTIFIIHHFLYSKCLTSARLEFTSKKFSGSGDFSEDWHSSLSFLQRQHNGILLAMLRVNRHLNFSRLGRFIAVSCIKITNFAPSEIFASVDLNNTLDTTIFAATYTFISTFRFFSFKSTILFVCIMVAFAKGT